MTRWNPLRELEEFQNRILGAFNPASARRGSDQVSLALPEWMPVVDIAEDDKEYAITAELVDTFLDEAPQLLEQLTAALAAGQADAFRRTAHSLKTNALTFGALTLAAKARELEQQSIESVNADGAHPLHALAQEYARVVAALKALCHAV